MAESSSKLIMARQLADGLGGEVTEEGSLVVNLQIDSTFSMT